MILRLIAPYLITASIAAGVLFACYWYGASSTQERLEALHLAQIQTIKAEGAKALAEATEAMRKQEQQHAAAMADLDAQKTRELENEKAAADAVIAGLRADTIRVRDQFTCGASTPAAGQAGATPGMGDAGKKRGFQKQDAEFLLREAARADEVTMQLQACQAIIRADRGQP